MTTISQHHQHAENDLHTARDKARDALRSLFEAVGVSKAEIHSRLEWENMNCIDGKAGEALRAADAYYTAHELAGAWMGLIRACYGLETLRADYTPEMEEEAADA